MDSASDKPQSPPLQLLIDKTWINVKIVDITTLEIKNLIKLIFLLPNSIFLLRFINKMSKIKIKIPVITEKMKKAAAFALAGYVKTPTADNILPDPLDKNVANVVAEAVRKASGRKIVE